MESTLIYHMGYVKAHFCHNKKRIFYTTNVKVSDKCLDGKLLIKPKALTNWQNLNEQIIIRKNQLDYAILQDIRQNGDVDVDRIKSLLSKKNSTEKVNEKKDKNECHLSEMLADFLSNQPKMNRGLKWRFELLQAIIFKNNLKCMEIKVPDLCDILDQFRAQVNANTANTRYKNFKRFITWCIESGYTLPKIEWKRLTRPTFKPDFIFLTDERIKQLVEYIPKSESEKRIRDIFLVLIYTGMRYSDYFSLKSSEMHDGCIDKVAKKTKVRFKVPVHQVIREVVKKPPKMSGQKFNKGIQDLGKELKWSEMIRYQTDINEFKFVPFYEMLCSSVGRHTFATRALLEGIPHNIIMGWCGWTNSNMLFYYSERLKLHTTNWMAKIK